MSARRGANALGGVAGRFALYFEPDGYSSRPGRIMGRHAAGHSLLRAVVNAAAQSQSAITACVPDHSAARRFVEQVRELSSRTSARLESINALCDVNRALGLYVPGPGIVRFASLRLRGRIDAYSIVGVTHTIASHAALGSVVELPDSAVMPWDALICTSHSVRQAVNEALQAKIDFLQWRLGFSGSPALPQLPVIPLGVHCADYLIDPSVRVEARSVLGLSNDEVGLLFVGRLSFHAKAHPFPMFVGAEEAAKSTGKKLVLFMCGWFANDAIKEAFVSGAARYFPSGRTVFLEGGCQDTLRRAWAASDIFVSLSDNIQESFGLTPLEAMASGLPVLVSDWDGYRDTVRDGVDGFRIPVIQSLDAMGEILARHYESGRLSYDA